VGGVEVGGSTAVRVVVGSTVNGNSSTALAAELASPCYTVRRLRPEDAAGVAACVRRAYGEGDGHPGLYHADRIIRLNETGELVSAVAPDCGGRVVGNTPRSGPA
jgi:hypothetical protein